MVVGKAVIVAVSSGFSVGVTAVPVMVGVTFGDILGVTVAVTDNVTIGLNLIGSFIDDEVGVAVGISCKLRSVPIFFIDTNVGTGVLVGKNRFVFAL